MRTHLLPVLAIYFLMGCGGSKQEAVQQTSVVSTDKISLNQDQLKALSLQFGGLEKIKMSAVLDIQGRIDLPPQNIISVNFPLGGYLKSTKLIPGMHVSKGEVIAIIEDQSIVQLQQDYLSAKAKSTLSKLEYDRQKSLYDANAGTSKNFQQADVELKMQQVLVKGLSEKLKLIGVNPDILNENNITGQVQLTSTINGYVSKVNVNTGKYVQPTETLFELIDPDDIHVALTIFEKDLNNIHKGDAVKIHFLDDPSKNYMAEVILVNRGVDDNRTALAHCHFKNQPKNLLPGMYVEGEVSISNKEVQALPDDAVVRSGDKQFVFIKTADSEFMMKDVVAGVSKNGKTEIISGLDSVANDKIVLNNAFKLMGIFKNSMQ
ncbi:MAG: efflux RND transporter periplasmic adaptor subunit [Chitinophagia bacterium]|nr:efflux RND transporter periplasmic adaptor subunit [Chitinophagia bacterium]